MAQSAMPPILSMTTTPLDASGIPFPVVNPGLVLAELLNPQKIVFGPRLATTITLPRSVASVQSASSIAVVSTCTAVGPMLCVNGAVATNCPIASRS